MSQRLPVVWVYALDSGGCGACQQSIMALNAVRHQRSLSERGIAFTESPRAANVVLLTGALTAAAERPVRQVLGSIPEPKILVAVGDCATGGCVFSGSPLIAENASAALDAHIEVGGCPTSPESILEAISKAQRLIGEADALSGVPVTNEEALTDATGTDVVGDNS